jgi:hypothetical protein
MCVARQQAPGLWRTDLQQHDLSMPGRGVIQNRGELTFAGDLSDQEAALIGATQRPVAELAFSEPSGLPAWKDRPSWAVVATGDKAAGTDVTRSTAERGGAKITELDGFHVIMISQPQGVTDVIMEALAAVGSPAGAVA